MTAPAPAELPAITVTVASPAAFVVTVALEA